MYISCGYLYTQNESISVTCCVCFIGELTFMLPFDEHAAIWICCGNSFRHRSSASTFIIVIMILNRLLSQLFPLCIYFFPKLRFIYFCGFSHLLFLKFLLICASLDMRTVNEYHAGVQYPIVESFVENMLKYFTGQLRWKTVAERIAYRCKMGNSIQQVVAQKPPIRYIHLNLTVCLPQ